MAVSSRFSIRCQVKSISLPCRSHPSTIQIEQELHAAKTNAVAAKPSAETICGGLSQLMELYRLMDDLLNSSTTKVLIARQQNLKFVEDLIDESMKFLDVCGSISDMVSQMKEHIRDLQCALRRRKGDLSSENGIMKYNCFRKKMKKDVKGLVASLKQVDNNMTVVDSDDHQLAAVIKAVIGVGEMAVSVFESLLSFFSLPISKPNRLSVVVSKLIHKGMVACEDQQEQGVLNEFDSIDVALQTLCKNESSTQFDKMQMAKCRLERVEAQLEGMETRLECMFRHLIRTRATLLNIISQSHPSTLRIEQELNAAKSNAVVAKPSAETISSGLSQLMELYKLMDDLLNSSATQVLIARQRNMKFVEDLIDESMKFLDVCGSIREMVSQMKEHIRDLQCALRRRKGELSSENGIMKYNFFKKKMKKDVKGLVASLKQVDNNMIVVDSDDHQLAAVIKAVIGVSEMTVSIFESLLSFFSQPISKPNRWSLVVSKLIHKGMVACEDQQKEGVLNEFDSIDAALQTLCKYGSSTQLDKMQIEKSRFERLEAQLEGMETRLECMFRHLIRTRATLLNIISQ